MTSWDSVAIITIQIYLVRKRTSPGTLWVSLRNLKRKKRKEEEKRLNANQKEAAYKQLSELNYNLGGYETDHVYPYSTGSNLSMQAKN